MQSIRSGRLRMEVLAHCLFVERDVLLATPTETHQPEEHGEDDQRSDSAHDTSHDRTDICP